MLSLVLSLIRPRLHYDYREQIIRLAATIIMSGSIRLVIRLAARSSLSSDVVATESLELDVSLVAEEGVIRRTIIPLSLLNPVFIKLFVKFTVVVSISVMVSCVMCPLPNPPPPPGGRVLRGRIGRIGGAVLFVLPLARGVAQVALGLGRGLPHRPVAPTLSSFIPGQLALLSLPPLREEQLHLYPPLPLTSTSFPCKGHAYRSFAFPNRLHRNC